MVDKDNGTIALFIALFALILGMASLLNTFSGSYEDLTDIPETPNIDLQHGLVLWLPFDGLALDKCGYDNDGIVYNALYIDGIFDRCLNFTGSDYVEVSDSESLNFTDSLTLSVWIKPFELIEDDRNYWILNMLDGTGNYGFGLGIKSNKFRLILGGIQNWEIEYDFNISDTYYLCSTFNGTNIMLYTNNTLLYEDSFSYDVIDNSVVSLDIGKFSGYSIQYFIGYIDDVRIYNRVLSSYEIEHIYTLGV